MNRTHGALIVLEGNDGAGKTTLANLLETRLKDNGYDVLRTREPGGCGISEQIRQILLDPANDALDPMCEALLYTASRRQHFVQTIWPALEQGKIILSDRFLDSSLAYQGYGRHLGKENIEALNDTWALQGYRPDLVLFLHLDEKTEKERMMERGGLDRMDAQSEAFHHDVREGFETLMKNEPERFACLDASHDPNTLADLAWKALQPVLEQRGNAK